jgi:small basic protein
MNTMTTQPANSGFFSDQAESKEEFKPLTERAQSVVSDAKIKYAELDRRVKNLKFWYVVFSIVIFVGLAIGIAVGVTFNEALLTNTREALTAGDWALRIFTAMAMEATLMAVVAGIHATFNPRVEMGKRIFGFLVAIALVIGTFILAASFGYAKFASLLDMLWHGAGAVDAANQRNFDPTVQAAAPLASVPFALRLASASMFLGAGFLVAIAEIAWLTTHYKLAETRERLSKYAVILDRHASYQSKRAAFLTQKEKIATLLDPELRRAKAHQVVFQGIEEYKAKVEANRPAPLNAALVDKSTWDRHQIDSIKTEQYLKSADAVTEQESKIFELIDKFFPKSNPPTQPAIA